MSTVAAAVCILLFAGIPSACSSCETTNGNSASLNMISSVNNILTYECSTNLGASFSRWIINDEKYEVTSLPVGYSADGLNITFQYIDEPVRLQCFFKIPSGDTAVDICSNPRIYPESPSRQTGRGDPCPEHNIAILTLTDSFTIYLSLEDNSNGCQFMVEVYDCTSDPESGVRESGIMEINNRIDFALQYIVGRTFSLKVEATQCTCGNLFKYYYLPNVSLTEYKCIPSDYTSIIHDVSSELCKFDPIQYKICIHLGETNVTNCFDEGCKNDPLCVDNSNGNYLKIVDAIENGTIISFFCTNKNCTKELSDVLIFNLAIVTYDENSNQKQCMCSSADEGCLTFKAPPKPILNASVECNSPPSDKKKISISWMDGEREEGVVYPGEEKADVELFPPEETVCSDVIGTNCTFSISKGEDHYTVSLTLTNDAGSSEPVSLSFNCTPDPPSNLGYNDGVVIEDSVNLRWIRPSYTGGVPLDHYNITANNETRMAENDMETVQFSPGLVYGDVLVTAINTCGQESEPAVINIPAAAPPDVSSISTQFSCEDISSPWSVGWMNETREEGVVYPGDVEVVVRANETEICPDVTAAVTSCTPNIPRGLYNISITQSNDIGSTTDSKVFDTMILTAVLQSDKLEDLSVDVTVNAACPETQNGYNVRVTFGARPVGTTSCVSQKNVTAASPLRSGETVQFSVDAESVSLEPGEEYCYIVSLDGAPVIIGGGGGTEDGAISSSALSTGAIAGIAVSVVFFVVLITVVLVVVLVVIIKKKKRRETENTTELKAISSPGATEEGVQDTISRTLHPETGEVYTDVNLNRKSTKEEESGPVYQDPQTIEHEEAASGDVYAKPQKTEKTGKKGKKPEAQQEEAQEQLTEEKAALYSVPNKQKLKAAGEGLLYAQLAPQSSNKEAPPSQRSNYVDIKHDY